MSSTVFYADPAAEFATLSNTWTVGGTPTDPTTISLVVTDPLGVQTTYTYPATITRTGTGVYAQAVPSTSDGLWSYVWVGTGTASAVSAGTWSVAPAAAATAYVGAFELKSRLGITDTAFDFEISRACLAAQADIEQFTGRYFWQSTGVRTYRNHSIYDVEIDDTVSVTTLKTDADGDGVYETVWTASQFQLEVTEHEYNVSGKGEPWPYTKIQALGVPGGNYLPYVWAWSHQDRVQVTGVFGWPKIPFNVREAALLLAVDHFKIKDAPFGIAGFGEYGPVRVIKNPTVASLLHRYIRPRVKVGV